VAKLEAKPRAVAAQRRAGLWGIAQPSASRSYLRRVRVPEFLGAQAQSGVEARRDTTPRVLPDLRRAWLSGTALPSVKRFLRRRHSDAPRLATDSQR